MNEMGTGKKYEFTGETKLYNGVTLHQIRAVSTSAIYYEGAIGGWIQSEKNLSHDDTAWIHPDAHVYGKVVVKGKTFIKNSEISGDGVINGNISIFDSIIHEKFYISGFMHMTNTELYGNTILNNGNAQISNSKIGNLQVIGKELVTIEDSVLSFEIERTVISNLLTISECNIRFSELVVEADTFLGNVNLVEDLDLIVKDTFHMEFVKSSTPNRIRINKSDIIKTWMRGNPNQPIHLERAYLVLHNSTFKDSCFIAGSWRVFDSTFEDWSYLKNDAPVRVTMRTCSLKEYSSMSAPSGSKTFFIGTKAEVVNIKLSGDDESILL